MLFGRIARGEGFVRPFAIRDFAIRVSWKRKLEAIGCDLQRG